MKYHHKFSCRLGMKIIFGSMEACIIGNLESCVLIPISSFEEYSVQSFIERSICQYLFGLYIKSFMSSFYSSVSKGEKKEKGGPLVSFLSSPIDLFSSLVPLAFVGAVRARLLKEMEKMSTSIYPQFVVLSILLFFLRLFFAFSLFLNGASEGRHFFDATIQCINRTMDFPYLSFIAHILRKAFL